MKNLAFSIWMGWFGGLVFLANSAWSKTVRYDLTVTTAQVNLSGKKTVDFALQVNGSIPAPTLEFTEGDEAEIVVHNRIPEQELSIHWHGILLPPEEDGVSYVNTPPIFSGKDHTFRFKIRQHGTYWYHSHTGLQEQKGVFGALVIHPRQKLLAYDKEVVAVLSDWSDENADQILKNLRKDGDYYLYKKNTMRSWWGAIQAKSLGNFLYNEWTRMGGMDYSDVGYDAFLINGKRDSQLITARRGERIRLRIINAAASTYFQIALGKTPMQVIAADGVDIAPIAAQEILMGMAETYDVLFQIPEDKNYEFKITAQDGTGTASGWIGQGEKVLAPERASPDLYATMDHSAHAGMDHGAHGGGQEGQQNGKLGEAGSGHGGHAGHGGIAHPEGHSNSAVDSQHGGQEGHSMHGHSGHSSHTVTPVAQLNTVSMLTVDEIQAKEKTAFPTGQKTQEVRLVLGGDMERYVWHINGQVMSQDRTIAVSEGDVVRFVFENTTMMHHPMHLHGHFFRVVNRHGAYSPLKHTVDVPPHGTRTIEFLANEPGEWMLHCHNLYHMKSGMARVVQYLSYQPKPELKHLQHHDPHLHDHWYWQGMAEVATNHAQAYLRLSQTWNQWEARLESRNTAGKNFSFQEPWEVEGDLFYRRWFNQYLNLVGGGTVYDRRGSAVLGVGYVWPFLIQSNLLVNHRGQFRLDLEKRFQWFSQVYSDVDFVWRPGQSQELGHDVEFEISTMYAPTWSWAVGLMVTNASVGAGAQVRF